jgi:hypothetical protein
MSFEKPPAHAATPRAKRWVRRALRIAFGSLISVALVIAILAARECRTGRLVIASQIGDHEAQIVVAPRGGKERILWQARLDYQQPTMFLFAHLDAEGHPDEGYMRLHVHDPATGKACESRRVFIAPLGGTYYFFVGQDKILSEFVMGRQKYSWISENKNTVLGLLTIFTDYIFCAV